MLQQHTLLSSHLLASYNKLHTKLICMSYLRIHVETQPCHHHMSIGIADSLLKNTGPSGVLESDPCGWETVKHLGLYLSIVPVPILDLSFLFFFPSLFLYIPFMAMPSRIHKMVVFGLPRNNLSETFWRVF